MAIEIVDFPIKNGDFPSQTVSLPEGIVNGSFGIRFLHVILLLDQCANAASRTSNHSQPPSLTNFTIPTGY